jgi:hypothetical protein
MTKILLTCFLYLLALPAWGQSNAGTLPALGVNQAEDPEQPQETTKLPRIPSTASTIAVTLGGLALGAGGALGGAFLVPGVNGPPEQNSPKLAGALVVSMAAGFAPSLGLLYAKRPKAALITGSLQAATLVTGYAILDLTDASGFGGGAILLTTWMAAGAISLTSMVWAPIASYRDNQKERRLKVPDILPVYSGRDSMGLRLSLRF